MCLVINSCFNYLMFFTQRTGFYCTVRGSFICETHINPLSQPSSKQNLLPAAVVCVTASEKGQRPANTLMPNTHVAPVDFSIHVR